MPDLPGGIPVPPHAYVPGTNARHPEGWFDPIKATVGPDMSATALQECRAFAAGRAYLEAGYYWECHEVLEAVWMQTPDGSPEREMVQALIQLANARLKLRMERPAATLRLCGMVSTHLARCPPNEPILGIRASDVEAEVTEVRNEAQHRKSAL